MKTILVDLGSFYTKVYVMHPVHENGSGDRPDQPYRFYGRSFFPTLISPAGELEKGRMYYEHAGNLYAVGYDCSNLRFEQIIPAFDGPMLNSDKVLLILKKIVFDYADHPDDLEIQVLVDCCQRARVVEDIGDMLGHRKVEISAFRGFDQRCIRKEVTIRLGVLSAGEALVGFLEKNIIDFTTGLVVDVGYNKTKLYMVDCRQGVEQFKVEDCGVAFFYEKLVHLLAEENREDNHFLWLVKQIELGCREVEVRRENKVERMDRTAALINPLTRHYDISLVLENVRWELNKEFLKCTTDMLTTYYANRTEWPAILMVTGGGASLNGDILRLSLQEGGYRFHDVHIERQPIYTLLEGAGYMLNAPPAD